MGFYGNILNRLDKYFNRVKVKTGSRSEDVVTIEAVEDGSESLNFTSQNGIALTAGNGANNKYIDIDGAGLQTTISSSNANDKTTYTFSQGGTAQQQIAVPKDIDVSKVTSTNNDIDTYTIKQGTKNITQTITVPHVTIADTTDTTSDNGNIAKKKTTYTFKSGGNDLQTIDVPKDISLIQPKEADKDDMLQYILKQGDYEVGKINIPLQLLLKSSEVIIKTEGFTGGDGIKYSPGTYLHLIFWTNEYDEDNDKASNTVQHCYINVTSLNEIAGTATSTITVNVDANQKITASVINDSIGFDQLTNQQKQVVIVDESSIDKNPSPDKYKYKIEKDKIADDKYQYTAYVSTKSGNSFTWEAMDGNYDASNVYLSGTVTLSGDYTTIGNITKSSNAAVSKYVWDGKSVKDMFEDILSKVLYPTKPSPSVDSWSLSNAGAKEIGDTIIPTFKVKYDPKTYAYGSTKNSNAGTGTYAAGDDVTIILNDGSTLTGTIGGDGSSKREITINGTSIDITSDTNYKGASVSIDYTEGAIPLTNTGVQHADAQVKAGTCSNTTATNAITHYREGCFYGITKATDFSNASLTNSFIRGLNKLNAKYSATSRVLNVTSGTTAIIIACPAGKAGPKSVLNTTVNAEMWNETNFVPVPGGITVGGADSTADGVGLHPTTYNVWVYKPAEAYSVDASLTITLG